MHRIKMAKDRMPVHRSHFLKATWFRYAAILLLIASTATCLYITSPLFRRNPELTKTQPPQKPQDIQPGGNKAILTLSDGRTIVLDNDATGTLAQQGGTKILKPDAGKISYQTGNGTGEMMYNTVSTPRGGQYQIILPDGTRAWLNAASSIRFPTAFASERRVDVSGEVYFEIAADAKKPFLVNAAHNTEIQVLGTSFNIKAYDDEKSATTTLIEGSVKVVAGNTAQQQKQAIVLIPGQQALAVSSDQHGHALNVNTNLQLIRNTDIEQVMAWKNGMFMFKAASVQEVMVQLSRWYDIEVTYEGVKPVKKFSGKMPRNVSLKSALKVMEFTGIKFKIEGRKVIVVV